MISKTEIRPENGTFGTVGIGSSAPFMPSFKSNIWVVSDIRALRSIVWRHIKHRKMVNMVNLLNVNMLAC